MELTGREERNTDRSRNIGFLQIEAINGSSLILGPNMKTLLEKPDILDHRFMNW